MQMRPTVAEEHFAKLIAFWHGQKIVVCGRNENKTVAALRGYDSGWSWELDKYVDAHWHEYVPAAKAIIERS